MIKEKNYKKYLIKPHIKKSRSVEDKDMETIIKDAHILYNLCHSKVGIYLGAEAMAHPQINEKDPLRFFVTKDKRIIINPIIARHTRHTVPFREGCISYPDKHPIDVQRWNKCEVEYQEIDGETKKLLKIKKNLKGRESKIFQHEIDHFDAKYIYN